MGKRQYWESMAAAWRKQAEKASDVSVRLGADLINETARSIALAQEVRLWKAAWKDAEDTLAEATVQIESLEKALAAEKRKVRPEPIGTLTHDVYLSTDTHNID